MSDTPSAASYSTSAYGGGGGGGNEPISDTTLQLQMISLNARILRQTNPWMGDRPDIMMELAMSGLPPDQLAAQGASLYGMQSIDGLMTSLQGLSGPGQRSVYNRLTDQQQRALDQMGYQPPNEPSGLLGDIGKGIGFAMSPVVSGVSTVAGPPVKGALDALTWMGDQPAHLYRAIRLQDDWKQWAALGGTVAGAALVIGTGGLALAALPTLYAAGAIGGAALLGATSVAAVTGRDEWWDALNQTWDGEKVFERGAQTRARLMLNSDELMNLAKDLALEMDPYELATEVAAEGGQLALQKTAERVATNMVDPGSEEYQTIFGGIMTLMQQEPFMNAVDVLQQGKISFGRDIGDTLGLDHSGAAYNLISGAADAFWLLSMDPTLMAGSVNRMNRIRKYGVTVGDPAHVVHVLTEMAEKYPKIKATQFQVAKAVENGRFRDVPTAYRGMWNPMREWYADPLRAGKELTEVDFREFIGFSDNITHILGGKGTIRGISHVVMSPVNDQRGWGRFVREMRDMRDEWNAGGQEVATRQLAEQFGVVGQYDHNLPQDVLEQGIEVNFNPGPKAIADAQATFGSYVGSAMGYWSGQTGIGYAPRTVGRLIRRLTTMAPAGRTLRLVGEGSEVDIPRLINAVSENFGMNSKVANEWIDFTMNQGAVDQRLAVVEAFLDDTFSLGGMHSSPALQELGDTVLRKFHQTYGLGGLDVSNVNGVRVGTGLLPVLHQASVVVVPEFHEMIRAVRRGHLLNKVAKITDSNFVEQAMSRVWKPSVLLRIAFIPRAFGEEGLAFLARMTEGGLAQEFGARNVAERAAYERAAYKRLHKIPMDAEEYAALSWQVPAHLRPVQWMLARHGWKEPVEQMLEDYGRSMSAHLRRGIGKEIPQITERAGLFGFGKFSPQWYQPLVYGKEHSWRRMILEGVDPDMIRAADSWVAGHADAILRGTSAMNASSFEKSIVNPDIQMYMAPDPKNPGKVIEEPYVMMRGERLKVRQGNPQYAAAVHHRIGELFMDDITGKVLANRYPRFLPAFADLPPQQIVDTIEGMSNVTSNVGRKLLLEALQPRNDNWKAAAQTLRNIEPTVANAIEESLFFGNNPTIDDIVRILRRDVDSIDDEKEWERIEALIQELEGAAPLFGQLDALDSQSKGWLSAGVSAHLSDPDGFYNMDALKGWASGDRRFVHERPRHLVYRGVPNMRTVQLRPSKDVPGGFDLVLVAQHQDTWSGNAISLTLSEYQAFNYAIKPVNQRQSELGVGAILELDGDFLAQHFGTTWDDVMSRPIHYSDPSHDPELIGPHVIGSGQWEFAIATNREGAVKHNWDVPGLQAVFPELPGNMDLGQAGSMYLRFISSMDHQLHPRTFDEAFALFEKEVRVRRGNGTLTEPIEVAYNKLNDIYQSQGAGAAETWVRDIKTNLFDTVTGSSMPDEIVVPWGKWAVQDKTQMEMISAGARAGKHESDKWAYLADLKWQDSAGNSVEEIAMDVKENVDQILESIADASDPTSPIHSLQAELQSTPYAYGPRGDLTPDQLEVAAGELAHLAGYDTAQEINTYINEVTAFTIGNNRVYNWWNHQLGQRTPEEAVAYLKQITADAGLTSDNSLFQAHGQLINYFMGLEPDTREIVGEMLGVSLKGQDYLGWTSTDLEAINESAALILQDRSYTDMLTDFVHMRGEGGHQFELPRWAPFQQDRDAFLQSLQTEVFAEMMKPENAEWIRKSRFALETADGERVVRPMQEGLKRVYVPVRQRPVRHTPGGKPRSKVAEIIEKHMDDASSTDELVERVAADLLSRHDAFRVHTEFVTEQMTQQERMAALSDAVRASFHRARQHTSPYGSSMSTLGGMSGPLDGVAYDDPRIAQWISDIMWGSEEPGGLGQYYLDIPRKLGGLDDDPIPASRIGKGQSWFIPEARRSTINHISSDNVVQLADGSQEYHGGVAFTKALEDWSKIIARKMELEHTAGTTETYEVLDEGANVLRRKGDELVPLTPGERLSDQGEEELFDAEGGEIRWSDERYFKAHAETGDEFLWEVIGPMIRDWHEGRAGFTSRIPKTDRASRQLMLEGEQPMDQQLVNMTRSRIDDIHSGVRGLPTVAVAEMKVPHVDRMWDRMIRYGFDKVIGPTLDAVVRKPMSFHYYAAARRQNDKWFTHLLDRKLIDETVPAVFGRPIDEMDRLTQITPAQLEAGRKFGRFKDNMPDDVTDLEVARYIASIGPGDRKSFLSEIGKAKQHAANNPEIGFTPADFEPLTDFSVEAVRLMDVSGSATNGERFVRAYYDTVPSHVWEQGQDAVNRFLAGLAPPVQTQYWPMAATDASPFGEEAITKTTSGLPVLTTEDQFETMHAAVKNFGYVQGTLDEASKLRALENVVPFLDSHEQRTQFAAVTKNMLPFWYAEENFLKRWARTFSIDGTYGLATLRKGQLAYMGIRSAGIIRTDVNGKDWFVYPGSGLLAENLGKLPIIPDTLPVGVMFQADVQSMLPGMNANFGQPGFSPFIALPIDTITRLFPDAVPVKKAVLGEMASSQSALNQFVPVTVRRVWEAAFKDEDSSRRYAAAMMAAAAMMEAEGNGLPDEATPDQLEGYMDRLRNHARIVMWAQAITGFVVPGAPITLTTGEDLGSFGWLTGLGVESPDELISAKYRSYVMNLGIDEGTSRFLAEFPNSDMEDVVNPLAYSTSMSASVSGAPLPATEHGMSWYNDNQSWVDSMPEAGAWFLPRPETGEAFDFYSYNQQLQNGLRKQRKPEEFVRALKYRNAASVYFDAKDQVEQAAIALGGQQDKKRQLDEVWATWRETWLAAHPIFAEELVSGEARERRARTIDQIRYAVSDPQAPATATAPAIREMSQAFDAYKIALAQLANERDAKSREKAKQLRQIWDTWSAQWVMLNPDLEQLWSAVYRPESGL